MRVGVCELEREKIGIITNPNYYKLLQRCQTIEEKDERFRSEKMAWISGDMYFQYS